MTDDFKKRLTGILEGTELSEDKKAKLEEIFPDLKENKELEAIKKTNGGWLGDQKHDEKIQTVDFGQELYKAFGQVKDFTLGMRIAKWFYDMGKNSQELCQLAEK